jgi:histone arginine demethylase JMJD6
MEADLDVECLERVLGLVPARERHRAAARVSQRWYEACVVLALRERCSAGAEHVPMALPRSVAVRVRAAQARIDPEAAPEAWSAHGFGKRPFDPACCRTLGRVVPSIDVAQLDLSCFREQFAGRAPVLITGLASQWPATQRWSLEQLWHKSARGGSRLRVGDDDETGLPVRLKMRDYLQYLLGQTHDDPLYLFDEDFSSAVPDMLEDYTVPAGLFADDVLPLYKSLNDGGPVESEQSNQNATVRPMSRKWLLIGPRGSGTDVHTDPDGTSAWNSVIHGCKRWAFVDPCVPESDVLGPESHYKQALPAQCWFADTLPLLVERYPQHVQELIQPPGSMVYIPEGWWHAVWNVEDTVAITHNSISRVTFEKHWHTCQEKIAKKKGEQVSASTGITGPDADVKPAGQEDRPNEEADEELRIVKRLDRLFGFEDMPSTQRWCRLLRSVDAG